MLAIARCIPIHIILRAITVLEAESLRLLLLVPDQQLAVASNELAGRVPSTVSDAEASGAIVVLQRAPNDAGCHLPFDGAALLLALGPMKRSELAARLYVKSGPDAGASTRRSLTTRSRASCSSSRGPHTARAQ